MEFSFSGELFLKYTCNFESDNFESKVGQLSPADAEFYLWFRVSKSMHQYLSNYSLRGAKAESYYQSVE